LVGIITEKEEAKVYSGNHQGKFYYKLLVKCENRPEVKTIFVFPDLPAPQVLIKKETV
jgi:hypothetical protein